MKAYRKVLVALILGLVGLSLVVLSAQLRVVGGSKTDLSAATRVRDHVETTAEAISQNASNRSKVDAWQSHAIQHRQQQIRDAIVKAKATARRKSLLSQQHSSIARTLQAHPLLKQVLEFVHITKTGGTAVEIAAGEAGLRWGTCHWRHLPRYGIGCRRPDWVVIKEQQFQLRNDIPIPEFHGEFWHTPPAWFQNSPYKGTPTFTIVRNPYDRVVSEFYCQFFGYFRGETRLFMLNSGRRAGHLRKRPVQNPRRDVEKHGSTGRERHVRSTPEPEVDSSSQETLKGVDYVEDRHRKILAKQRGKRPLLPPPTVQIFNRWIRTAVKNVNPSTGHMLSQSYYVYDNSRKSGRVVDHVLKYENVQQEFNDLMRRYGLERVKLSRCQPPPLDPFGRPRFTAAHLEPLTICLINRRYAQDFEIFGYPTKSCESFDENAVMDEEPEELQSENHTLDESGSKA